MFAKLPGKGAMPSLPGNPLAKVVAAVTGKPDGTEKVTGKAFLLGADGSWSAVTASVIDTTGAPGGWLYWGSGKVSLTAANINSPSVQAGAGTKPNTISVQKDADTFTIATEDQNELVGFLNAMIEIYNQQVEAANAGR